MVTNSAPAQEVARRKEPLDGGRPDNLTSREWEAFHEVLGDVALTLALPEGILLSADSALANLVGQPPDGDVGLSAGDLFQNPSKALSLLQKMARESLAVQGPVRFTLSLKHAQGHPVEAEWAARARPGSPRILDCLVRDLSAQENVRRELQLRQEKEAAILKALPDLIFLQDDQGIFTDYHAANPKDLLLPASQFLGKTIHDVLPQPVADQLAPLLTKTLQTGKMQRAEYTLPRQGILRSYEARIVPCGHSCTLTIIRDISDRRLFEDNVAQVQKLEALGRLAGGIAHDFNNLLTVILGNTDMLQRGMSVRDSNKELADEIMKAAIRASRLTGHLLAFSGKSKFAMRPCHLNSVTTQLLESLRNDLPSNITITTNLPETIPPVQGDPTQIQVVLHNLLGNAMEAMGQRKGRICVSAGLRKLDRKFLDRHETGECLPEGNYVFLAISDNGPGITEAGFKKLFDPFFTTKQDQPGRGMGLAVARGIVRSFKGLIHATRNKNAGLTFTIYLPEAPPTPEAPLLQPGRALLSREARRRHTILVVDDEDSVRITTRLLLETHGFKTCAANSGRAGLSRLEDPAAGISAVLLDLTMPDINGQETYQRMRRISGEIPILFYSGYSEEEVSDLLSLDPKAGFLQKPFTSEALLEKLLDMLE